jgi:hypothetical protein
MTIYDFIYTITDACNIIFTVFDCNSEKCVFVETDEGEKSNLTAEELIHSELADYEIGDMDIWIDGNSIRIELNIELEEE